MGLKVELIGESPDGKPHLAQAVKARFDGQNWDHFLRDINLRLGLNDVPQVELVGNAGDLHVDIDEAEVAFTIVDGRKGLQRTYRLVAVEQRKTAAEGSGDGQTRADPIRRHILRCEDCGAEIMPPGGVCPTCQAKRDEKEE